MLSLVMEPTDKNWRSLASRKARDEILLHEIVQGNIPSYLRRGPLIKVEFKGSDGQSHWIMYQRVRGQDDWSSSGNGRGCGTSSQGLDERRPVGDHLAAIEALIRELWQNGLVADGIRVWSDDVLPCHLDEPCVFPTL